ncbi:hypothetical protein QZH41_004162 [Actinostola sp. cb2023]|nr:hypothetical protein QZH41_004162 [Actinostola sp. cb2023]
MTPQERPISQELLDLILKHLFPDAEQDAEAVEAKQQEVHDQRQRDQDSLRDLLQEPAPMTEDMLQEHAEVLTQLGTTQEGTRVRAQMQSASLLSDMEAFKAANPGCLLEDFVRWYSPNDWIPGKETREEEEELNNLEQSRKQRTPEEDTNASEEDGWDDEMEVTEEELEEVDKSAAVELMHEAKAGHVPELTARSKVLHFLAALKPAEVAFHLFPVLLHAVLLKIEEAGGKDIPAVTTLLDQVTSKARKLHWVLPDDLVQCELDMKRGKTGVPLLMFLVQLYDRTEFPFRFQELVKQNARMEQPALDKEPTKQQRTPPLIARGGALH